MFMIRNPTFLRGIQITKNLDWSLLNMYIGPEKVNNMLGAALSVKVPIVKDHTIEGLVSFDLNQRSIVRPFWSGFEYLGKIGNIVDIKADLGLSGKAEDDSSDQTITFLFEPKILIYNQTSLLASVYAQKDDLGMWSSNGKKSFDDFFIMLQPIQKINDKFSMGLSLEYHDYDRNEDDDESIWLVPNFYLKPLKNSDIRLWTNLKKLASQDDLNFSLGMELSIKY